MRSSYSRTKFLGTLPQYSPSSKSPSSSAFAAGGKLSPKPSWSGFKRPLPCSFMASGLKPFGCERDASGHGQLDNSRYHSFNFFPAKAAWIPNARSDAETAARLVCNPSWVEVGASAASKACSVDVGDKLESNESSPFLAEYCHRSGETEGDLLPAWCFGASKREVGLKMTGFMACYRWKAFGICFWNVISWVSLVELPMCCYQNRIWIYACGNVS